MRNYYDSLLYHELDKEFYFNSEEERERLEQEREEKEDGKNRHKIFSGGKKNEK